MTNFTNSDLEQIYTALGGSVINPNLYAIDNQILFLTDANCPALAPYMITDAIFLSIVNTGPTKIITSAGEIPAGNTDVFTFPNSQNFKQQQWAIIIPATGSCTVITQTKTLL